MELTTHFNPLIWRWDARAAAPAWERFAALCRLAEHEPASTDQWEEKARAAGIDWIVRELERLRLSLAHGRPIPDGEARPEYTLTRAPENLQDELYTSFEYASKAAEVYVWLDDLSNARSLANRLRGNQSTALGKADILSVEELEKLLILAELHERVQRWQMTDEQPNDETVKYLRHSYDTILKALGE
jgi:hypothetical protein